MPCSMSTLDKANFEAFRRVISTSINLLFLKSVSRWYTNQLVNLKTKVEPKIVISSTTNM